LQTTAVRLALRYALAYAAVLGFALAAWSWVTSRYQDSQVETSLEQEVIALAGAFEQGGAERLLENLVRHEAGAVAEEEDRLYLLVSAAGEKRGGNLLGWPTEASIAYDGKVHRVWIEEEVIPLEVYDDDAYCPVVAHKFPDGSRLLLAHRVRQAQELREITEYLTEVLGVAVLLALVMSVSLGRVIVGRMDAIGSTAAEIVAGDLSRRVPVSARNDEFDALAKRLNAMLDRIQQLIKGMREVTDNVAHDLRSPLTRLRNQLEITLLERRSEPEYRQAISRGIEDAESLIKTFNALLGIAQAEAGSRRGQWERWT